mmetsp:Transcript_3523/g.6157  ORF Transcript_3523/g.6157 Transcript_3523/m.6157 type:complete len:84 (+) Transcript_3523:797-1048(+)
MERSQKSVQEHDNDQDASSFVSEHVSDDDQPRPVKRQKPNNPPVPNVSSILEHLTAPLMTVGKTIAMEVSEFYNGLFGRPTGE